MGENGVYIVKKHEDVSSFIKMTNQQIKELEEKLSSIEQGFNAKWLFIGNTFINMDEVVEIKITKFN